MVWIHKNRQDKKVERAIENIKQIDGLTEQIENLEKEIQEESIVI